MTPETLIDGPRPGGVQDEAVVLAIRRLAFALKVRRFYPPGSQVLERKLQECLTTWTNALSAGPLRLDVLPEEIGWEARSGGYRKVEEPELALALHQRRVARLRIDPDLSLSGLSTLLDALADPKGVQQAAAGPILGGAVQGVRAEVLELDHLFDEHGDNPLPHQQIWSHVLSSFDQATGLGIDSWSSLARDVPSLTRLLDWALDPDTQPKSLQRYAQTDAFALLSEHIASVAVQDPATVLGALTEAAVALFDRIDPEAWLEILADPLPLDPAPSQDGSEFDLTASIARALSESQVQSLIRYAVRTRSHATPRLYRFLDRILRDRDRKRLARELLAQLPLASNEDFARAWPQFLNVLLGEQVEPFVNSDYQVSLEQAAAVVSDKPLWEPSMVAARLGDLKPSCLAMRRARITLSLLQRDPYGPDVRLLVESTLAAVPLILSQGRYALLEEFVDLLAHQTTDPLAPREAASSAREALATLRQPELLRALGTALAADPGESFHVLWRIIERLGPECVPGLLEALRDRASSLYRSQLARLLAEMPELPVESLRQGLGSDRAAFVRDLVWILGQLGRPETAPLLKSALEHSDPTVRREAVRAMVRIAVPGAEHALLRGLADPALEVRVAALRAFRLQFHGGPDGRLHHYLRAPAWRRNDEAVVLAAIQAVARMGDVSALPRLLKLSRTPWLFRKRRRAIACAARRAVVQLQKLQRQVSVPGSDDVQAPGAETRRAA